jgi:hypothetical protein
MTSLADNPFAALTVVVAPAILTNASSVLCLGTGNRIARVVDRTRVLTAEIARLDPSSPLGEPYNRQIARLRVRAHLLLRALRFFYTSIGSFAAAALISVIGSLLVTPGGVPVFEAIAALGLMVGAIGVAGLVIGCTVMVRETRLAVKFLEEEMDLLQTRPRAAH